MSNITENVSKYVKERGINISKMASRPDIEILMKLCDTYGIKDILKTFGYDGYKEDGSIQLNMKHNSVPCAERP